MSEEQIKKELRKRIAVDIDGTLTEKGKFPDIFKTTPEDLLKSYKEVTPNKFMIDWVNKMYDKGYVIFLFTSRSDLFQSHLKEWLKENHVKYHYYIMGKPYYDMIVDDKAIRPDEIEVWENTLK